MHDVLSLDGDDICGDDICNDDICGLLDGDDIWVSNGFLDSDDICGLDVLLLRQRVGMLFQLPARVDGK